jgi:hypothetical protein
MAGVSGTRLYGKVDEVPGLGHVATVFFHINFVPLIPTKTWFVLDQTSEGWNGAPISMSGKSVLVAWMRTACVLAFLVGGLFTFISVDRNTGERDWATPASCAVAGVLGFVGLRTRPFMKASYERALELAEPLGLTPTGKAMLDLAYEQISEAECQAILEKEAAARAVAEAQAARAQAEAAKKATQGAAPAPIPLRPAGSA